MAEGRSTIRRFRRSATSEPRAVAPVVAMGEGAIEESTTMRTASEQGFSFIEALVVLGVTAILAMASLPQLLVPDTLQAESTARGIAADLRLAQELSIATRGTYRLDFNPAASPFTSYTLYNASTGTVQPDFPKTLPSGLTVSGRRTVCFTPGGYVNDNCLGPQSGTDSTVTVSAGAKTATVQIFWYSGRVKVVAP